MFVSAYIDEVSDFGLTDRRRHPRRQFAPKGLSAHSGGNSLIYDSPRRRKDGLRLKLAPNGFRGPVDECPFLEQVASLFAKFWRLAMIEKKSINSDREKRHEDRAPYFGVGNSVGRDGHAGRGSKLS
ncbi:hypothetical protein CQ13_18070 [Bradyrhizobium retamae]|uniref:Uncharacterized protein n=1 Tax=Bradyrhizobium retamae TaxID=1300035 RepID=A0A0R3NG07_9BRAD|nr:hypothetical protein CQ13_18070 [Bradyrhizobium retamae]